jgi:drug/metabolite transporter (DMT)-like permease
MTSYQDYLKLHFLVFLWGFTAILGKLITIPAMEMVFYRTVLAALGMAFLLIISRKKFIIGGGDAVKLMLIGSIVAVHWLTFFLSGRISNPSTSLVGFATCSLWTALIEPLAKGRKIYKIEVGLGIVVMIGLYVIFTSSFEYPLGLVLGIISGLTIAIFAVINSELVKKFDSYTITFYEMSGAVLTLGAFFPVYLRWFSESGQLELIPSAMDWLWLAILAFVCTVYAYAAAINLMKRLSVFTIQLTLNLEPVYGIVLALLVFREKEIMSAGFYVGTAILISAVFSYPLLRRRFSEPQNAQAVNQPDQ